MIADRILTITMNAAIDRLIEAPGFSAGGHVAMREVARLPAGKGINVARALANLGKPCTAVALVGRHDRRWFERRLRETHGGRIIAKLIAIDGPTRECLTIRDPAARIETHLRAPGMPVRPRDVERLQRLVLSLIDRRTAVAFCGSMPPGMDPQTLRLLVRECVARSAGVLVDSSGVALKAMAREQIECVKINAEELSALTGARTVSLRSIISAARALCVRRIRPIAGVVVTRGRLGAVLVEQEGAVNVAAPTLLGRVVGTVGCGDAFLAGWLSASIDGKSARERMRFAVAVAGAHAVSPEPGMFSRRDATTLFRATEAESA